MSARPAGAYVVRGDDVSWRSAIDLNRILLGAEVVAIVGLLAIRSILTARAKAERTGG